MTWVRELLLGLLLLGALNAGLSPEDPGWLRVSPHPLLGLTAILAARHGTLAGVAAGAVAALVHLALQALTLASPGGALDFSLATAHLRVPGALILTGALLGEIRRRDARKSLLERRFAGELRAERDALKARLALSERTRQELERRAVEPVATLAALHEATDRLPALEPQAIAPAVGELLERYLDATRYAIYGLADGRLTLLAHGGEPAPPDERATDEGLLGAAIRERRVTSARDAGDRPGDAPPPALLAAPLLGKGGEPLGAVEIGAMPFLSLTASAEKVLGMLAMAGGRALEIARARALGGDGSIYDEAIGALRYPHLLERLAEEQERSRRYGPPFSLLLLELSEWEAVPPASRETLRRAVAQALKNVVRTIDAVHLYKDDRSFAVCLPHTGFAGVRRVAERVQAELERFEIEPYRTPGRLEYRMGAVTRVDEMRTPLEMLRAAEDDLQAPRLEEDDTGVIAALPPHALALAKRKAEEARRAKEAGRAAPEPEDAPTEEITSAVGGARSTVEEAAPGPEPAPRAETESDPAAPEPVPEAPPAPALLAAVAAVAEPPPVLAPEHAATTVVATTAAPSPSAPEPPPASVAATVSVALPHISDLPTKRSRRAQPPTEEAVATPDAQERGTERHTKTRRSGRHAPVQPAKAPGDAVEAAAAPVGVDGEAGGNGAPGAPEGPPRRDPADGAAPGSGDSGERKASDSGERAGAEEGAPDGAAPAPEAAGTTSSRRIRGRRGKKG